MQTNLSKLLGRVLGAMVLSTALTFSVGCDREADVLEVETPEGEVDVDRDLDTGALDVESE